MSPFAGNIKRIVQDPADEREASTGLERHIMRELVIVSGKGGTGKTSIAGAFAAMAENMVFCDADVDAADLHLLLKPEIQERHDFRAGHVAVIEPDLCTQCGDCVHRCRFQAISPYFRVDPIQCEGCGVCVHFCPVGAIGFPEKTCGQWTISRTRFGTMVHAQLGIAEENSGKLVSLVRREARRIAEECGRSGILTDGPPGIGCPVIASIGGATAVLVVSEPTVSGIHDLERVTDLAKHFGIPAMVCVNKADLYPEMSENIELFCNLSDLRFMGSVPFDPEFIRAQIQGKTIVEGFDGPGKSAVVKLWGETRRFLDLLAG